MPRSPHKLNFIAFVFLQSSRNKPNYWSRPSFYNESFLELTCHIFPEVDIYEHKINLPRNTWSFSRYSHCLTIYVRSLCLPAGLLQVTDSELRMLVCSPPCECWHTIDTWLRRDRALPESAACSEPWPAAATRRPDPRYPLPLSHSARALIQGWTRKKLYRSILSGKYELTVIKLTFLLKSWFWMKKKPFT